MGTGKNDPFYNDKKISLGEKPQHKVYLSSYYIDKYEVTNEEYEKCVKAGVCKEPKDTTYYENPNYSDHPVIGVSWYQACSYCKFVKKRLPTEAEWEKAARGTDGRIYPWGNKWDKNKCNNWNYNGNKEDMADIYEKKGTLPVGSIKSGASPYGVMDLIGNVFEWVQDIYEIDYYENSPKNNPKGPEKGKHHQYRVLRGGSWLSKDLSELRNSARFGNEPDETGLNYGFRCAVSE